MEIYNMIVGTITLILAGATFYQARSIQKTTDKTQANNTLSDARNVITLACAKLVFMWDSTREIKKVAPQEFQNELDEMRNTFKRMHNDYLVFANGIDALGNISPAEASEVLRKARTMSAHVDHFAAIHEVAPRPKNPS